MDRNAQRRFDVAKSGNWKRSIRIRIYVNNSLPH